VVQINEATCSNAQLLYQHGGLPPQHQAEGEGLPEDHLGGEEGQRPGPLLCPGNMAQRKAVHIVFLGSLDYKTSKRYKISRKIEYVWKTKKS